MPLYGHVYTNDLTAPVHLDDFSKYIEDITLNWALHGGFQSAEVVLNCSYSKAYIYYRRYIGKRVIIDDQVGDKPVADGFMTSAAIRRSGVTFTINGFWFRHSDQLYVFDETIQDYQQGFLYYVHNGFFDGWQDFADWESSSSPAVYDIEVINHDGTISWGFLGAAFDSSPSPSPSSSPSPSASASASPSATASVSTSASPSPSASISPSPSHTPGVDSIYVYTDYNLTTPGWNGEDPTGKTPISYNIYITYDYWTTSECIEEALTNEVPSISISHINIDDTGTVVGRYRPPSEEGGMYPAEFIEKMASMSDSDNNQWNYWLVNNNFDNGLPQKPIPYFKSQVLGDYPATSPFDWLIENFAVAKDDVAAREMFELRNHVRIIFRDMAEDDLISITDVASDEDSISDYWRREAIISGGDNTIETAEYYRDLYLNDYKDPVMGLPIEIQSSVIRDKYGRPYSLWSPIKYNKSYFRHKNLFPEYGMTSRNQDGIFTGQAMSMEYTYSDNTLRINLDTESNELDAVIARIDAFA